MTVATLRLVPAFVQTSAHPASPLLSFSVTVRTLDQRLHFPAIGHAAAQVHADQLERFGGLCSVVVIPTREAIHGN